jgi:hypothetical protein
MRIYYSLSISLSEHSSGAGGELQISFPSLPKAGSPTYFTLLRAWLRWCGGSHDCMGHNAKSKAALPSRLLDIGNSELDILRLFSPNKKQEIKYAAVSHCWGRLTDENKRQFLSQCGKRAYAEDLQD